MITDYSGLIEQMVNDCEPLYYGFAKKFNAYIDGDVNMYSYTLPSKYLDFFGIKTVGGKTVLFNQINNNGFGSETVNGVTFTKNSDGSWTVDGTASADISKNVGSRTSLIKPKYKTTAGKKYYIHGCPSGGSMDSYSFGFNVGIPEQDTGSGIVGTSTITSDWIYPAIIIKSGTTVSNLTFYPQIHDLTVMFGTGNEPTTEECRKIFAADYYPYNTGVLISAGVKSITIKDSNDNVLQKVDIPNDVQSLEGYGYSCPTAYNYIDLVNRKYVQNVGSRAYTSGDEGDASVITDDTTTHYQLSEPVITDISIETITGGVLGGTLLFENTAGADYLIPVPVGVEMIGV